MKWKKEIVNFYVSEIGQKKNGNGGWEDERWISESISPIKMCQI